MIKNMKKVLVSLVGAFALAAASPVNQPDVALSTPPSLSVNMRVSDDFPKEVVDAASGKGEYSETQRLIARIGVCKEAMKVGLPPSVLSQWMEKNAFTKDATLRTLEVCIAFSAGMEYSVGSMRDEELAADPSA